MISQYARRMTTGQHLAEIIQALSRSAVAWSERGQGGLLDISQSAGQCPPPWHNAWPDYLAYIVSFLTIGAAWLAHTALTEKASGVVPDPDLLALCPRFT